MDRFKQQEALWKLKQYVALDEKRRRAANAILIEGKSFSRACRDSKLNPSRENVGALRVCVTAFEECYSSDGSSKELSIYGCSQ